jgi:phage tail tape measure protein, TP901 family, core region
MAGKVIDVTLQLIDRMTGPLEKAGSKLAAHANQYVKAGRQIQNAGKGISAAGQSMTAKLTMPIAAAGTACVKLASDFESGMSKVSSISGATGGQLDRLSKKAKEMGAKTKFSATEATEAYQYMAMAGWKTKDMLNGIQGVMTLAGASGESLASTSDIVTDALTAFGMTAKDTTRFTDVLAAASSNANTNVAMLGESFKYAAPVAGSLGYSVEDVSLALGVMANSGIKASSAGTALRSLLTNMAKPTKTSAAAMEKLGISLTDSKGKTKELGKVMGNLRSSFAGLTESEKAEYAASLAGKTGMSGLLAIVNSSDKDFNKLSKAITDSNGACQKMYDTANDNLNGQLTILKSTVESIAISFGEKLTPYVKALTGYVQGMADRFNSLTDAQQNAIIKVLAIVAAIGPAILIFGRMVTGVGRAVSAVGKLGKAIKAAGSVMGLLTSPAGIVIAVIAGIALAAGLIYKNWDKVKPFVEKIGAAFQSAFGGAGGVIDTFQKEFGKVMGSLGTAVKTVIPAVMGLVQPIAGALAGGVQSAIPVIGRFAALFIGSLPGAIHTVSAALQAVIPVVAGTVSALADMLVPVVTTVISTVSRLVPVIAKTLLKSFKALLPVFNTVSKAVQKLVPVVGKFLVKAFQMLSPVMSKVAALLARTAGLVGGLLVRMFKKASPVISGLATLFSTVFGRAYSTASGFVKKLQPVISAVGKVISVAMDLAVPTVSAAFDHIGNVISLAVDFIGGLFDNLMDIFGGVINFVTGIFAGNWSQAWNGIVSIFKGIFNMIPLAVETVVNGVTTAVNAMISGINTVTGAVGVPSIPSIPSVTLPRLAKGTQNWKGGLVQVSERGGEVIDLPKGSRVYPHDQSLAMAREEGRRQKPQPGRAAKTTVTIQIPKLADQIIIREDADIDKLADAFADRLEKVSRNVGGGEIEYSY